jgi:hypothetical protein
MFPGLGSLGEVVNFQGYRSKFSYSHYSQKFEFVTEKSQMDTHCRRVCEEDGILLLGVAKDQQHHIQHHIRIEPSRSRTNRNKQQFHNT